jgi:DNA-nicking Smr family endonuclease
LSHNISDKDKKDWEEFLSSNENLPNKDIRQEKKNRNQSKTFDLHGFSLEEANQQIEKLILNSYENNVSKLIIVTGKGKHSTNEKDPYVSKDLGILKNSVPEFIKNNKELMKVINEIKDANIEDGGSGAFYIFLRKKLIK